MAKGKLVRMKVHSIRFFAKTVDVIVEPEGLYLELEVPGTDGFDAKEGVVTTNVKAKEFADVVAAYTDDIEVAIRKQREASVKRG